MEKRDLELIRYELENQIIYVKDQKSATDVLIGLKEIMDTDFSVTDFNSVKITLENAHGLQYLLEQIPSENKITGDYAYIQQEKDGKMRVYNYENTAFILSKDIVVHLNYHENYDFNDSRLVERTLTIKAYRSSGDLSLIYYKNNGTTLQIVDNYENQNERFVPVSFETSTDYTKFNKKKLIEVVGIVDLNKIIDDVSKTYELIDVNNGKTRR